jgi:hypothetical protein
VGRESVEGKGRAVGESGEEEGRWSRKVVKEGGRK